MAGMFEVFVDADSLFRFRLMGPDGTVMAVSEAFADKPAVAAGIAAVRECAGTGLVTDLSRVSPPAAAAQPVAVPVAEPVPVPVAVQPVCDEQRVPVTRLRAFNHAKAPRRQVPAPRWIGATQAPA
ncbi:YegP family protein [Pseudarthrobacter sp. YS3]|uniref:YegP family protein n=1 Tax=Pseudarthrobacter sp. YS3 TaxID=3453718 RepID=UPI003EEFDA88